MNHLRRCVTASVVVLCFAAPAAVADVDGWSIPRLADMVIDGRSADWNAAAGPSSGQVKSTAGQPDAEKSLQTTVRMGWDDRGLLMLLTMRDDQWLESDDDANLSAGDCIALLVMPEYADETFWMWMIAPGMSAGQDQPRVQPRDFMGAQTRGAGRGELTVARTRKDGACTLEILVPWTYVGVKAAVGREIGVQFYLCDTDVRDGKRSGTRNNWFPQTGTAWDHKRSMAVRLGPAVTRVRFAGPCHVDMKHLEATVTVSGPAAARGKTVTVVADGRPLASAVLAGEELSGPCRADLHVPLGPITRPPARWELLLDAKTVDHMSPPGGNQTRRAQAEALLWQSPVARPAVFSHEAFPEIRFLHPVWMRGLIGRYKIKTTFYDKDYRAVTTARTPGRYGAVVEIVTDSGTTYRRFLTLYRTPKSFHPHRHGAQFTGKLPEALGISNAAAKTHAEEISRVLNGAFAESLWRGDHGAVLIAGLHEAGSVADESPFYRSPRHRDRQWWVGLKRRLYGWDKRWPQPFVCPRPVEGPPAPVVREGTPAEAGMTAGAPDRIDAVLNAWAADSDQAFAVCIVRNGVIVLHKAYGTRDGKAMTVRTKSHMASSTKLVSGVCVMTAVDRGLVDLDTPIGEYLPALKGARTNQPLTVRRLYNHTSDLDWHWGSHTNDMSERIGVLLPHLRVGSKSQYNGTGMELVCKTLEAVSGRSMPNFYREYLLGPLGCDDTDMSHAGGGTRSIPLDYAKICQMLLNGGAYGKMRFMSPETLEQMLPRPLEETDHGVAQVYGVGCTWMDEEILGKGTYGHGAASAATVRVCPSRNLVVVMTRNRAGKNHGTYHPKFLQAIVDGIKKD